MLLIQLLESTEKLSKCYAYIIILSIRTPDAISHICYKINIVHLKVCLGTYYIRCGVKLNTIKSNLNNMKYTAALVFVTISMVHGSVLGGIGALVAPTSLGAALRGPSSAATVVGPDGSIISSGAEGGAVLAAPGLGGALTAGVAPGVVLGAGSRLIAAPSWGAPGLGLGGVGAVIQGPSGIVATNGNPWGGIGVPGARIIGPAGPLGLGLGQGVWGL